MWGSKSAGKERGPRGQPFTPAPDAEFAALAVGFTADRRSRQARDASFHDQGVVERVPGRGDIGGSRAPLVMAHVIADEVAGDAELYVVVDMLVVGRIDLRDQRLEARLVG